MPTLAEQIDSLEPGVIRVFRDADDDVGFREALIFLDGENLGSVDYKKVLELHVRPGAHTIHAYNRVRRSKTIKFEIKPGERLSFQAANVGGGFFMFWMMLLLGVPRMRLEQEMPEPLDAKTARNKAGRRQLH